MKKRNNKLNVYLSDEEKDRLNFKSKKYEVFNSKLIRIFINNNFEEDRFKLEEAKYIISKNIEIMTNACNLFKQMRFDKDAELILYNTNESKKFLSK